MARIDLISHGMSAFSVLADIITVRLLLAALALTGLIVVGLAALVTMRLLVPEFFSPGWATLVVGFDSLIALNLWTSWITLSVMLLLY